MTDIEITTEAPRHYVGIRRTVHYTDLPAFFAEAFPKVVAWLKAKGIEPETQPLALYHAMDGESGMADTHAAVIVAEPVDGEQEITAGATSGGELLKVVHVGPYAKLGETWGRAYARAKELGRPPGAGWEIYVDDPTEVAEDELRTVIHLPLG